MFQELNLRYYQLYSELYENKGCMSEKQYKLIQQTLYDMYAGELELILGQEILDLAKIRYEMKYRLRHYVPHWGNKMARQLKREFKQQFVAYLAELFAGKDEPREEVVPCDVTDLAIMEEDVHD